MDEMEKMQILKMIEDKKITPDEGLKLLNSVEEKAIKPNEKAKWLKVRVKTAEDKTKVKVNIPISLVDVGLRIGSAYSPHLKESGLDKIDFNEIIEAVKNGAEGKIVEVDDEETDTKVEVYVE